MFDAKSCDHGTKKQMFIPYTPQQNRVAERANRTIVKMVYGILHVQNLDKSFWEKTIANAVYTSVGLVLLFYDTSGVLVCNDFVAHY